MKKLVKIFTAGVFLAFTGTACNHKVKDEVVLSDSSDADVKTSDDHITKEVYTDEYGEKLEVTINEKQNTVVIRLGGKTYQLKKSNELPEYTAADAFYQYSNIKGNITFLNKDYNMVLFHHKKQKNTSGTKMASF